MSRPARRCTSATASARTSAPRSAPGVRPVLLARDGRAGEVEYGTGEPLIPELLVIRTLAELPSLLGV